MSSADPRALRVDGTRLWDSLMELARIGATPKGGVARLALTALDGEARRLFARWCEAAGCTIRVDPIGNIFARRAGTANDRAPVMTGSHIDSQPSGGKFDGAYGVLAGLEVIRALNDRGISTAAPIEVVVWTNEEGSRFQPVMMGSGVHVGALDLAASLAQRDRAGVTVGEALTAIGFAGATPLGHPASAYFEAHIEQGPILEDADTPIGVVTGALGLRWYDVRVIGQDAHAGPTPMRLRHDAMLAAAEITVAVNAIALKHQPDGRGTVGAITAHPNSRNVIPGRVDFTVDLRHSAEATLDQMESAFHAACADSERRHGVQFTIERVSAYPVSTFDPALVAAVRNGAQALGLSHMNIVSGAGHDAIYMARVTPAAMIFIPCEGGISHNEIESARHEHLEAGCNVLLQAILRAAE
ncbi:MAG: Zn-dependent hydrolase [Burkholderiales bacterium]